MNCISAVILEFLSAVPKQIGVGKSASMPRRLTTKPFRLTTKGLSVAILGGFAFALPANAQQTKSRNPAANISLCSGQTIKLTAANFTDRPA